MPGHDDTLNDGGPTLDPLDELCTCGHTRGEHHTLDEDCTTPGCGCESFQSHGHAFGEGQPSEAQLEAALDAHNDRRAAEIGESVRELTADLPGGEGRIGEIKNELDQILDAALLCDDANCRHRRDRHHTFEREGDIDCSVHDCVCTGFLEPKSTEQEPLVVPAFLRADALRNATRNSNTDEAADHISHDQRAKELDVDHAAEIEALTDDQLAESNRVQLETLDNLCTCGHRYGDHSIAHGDLCLFAGCECRAFDALLKPVELEFVHDSPVDPEAIRRATRGPADEQVDRVLGDNPFRFSCCLKCGHAAEDHAANGTVCHVEGCDCEALVEHTGDHDGRRPYTPPLLRKRLIGEDELRKVLIDAGRLDLLQQLPEVDRVTLNYGAEHWQMIESLVSAPQGSNEATRPESDRTTIAIATALLELRQCLGVSNSDSAALMAAIKKNAEVVDKTVETLELMSARLLPFVAKVLQDEAEDT